MLHIQSGNSHNSIIVHDTVTVLPLTNEITSESGRGNQKWGIPLVLGLKLTGLLSATFTAIKIFIVQTLVVSKIALLGAAFLLFKGVFEHFQKNFLLHKLAGWEAHTHHGPTFPELGTQGGPLLYIPSYQSHVSPIVLNGPLSPHPLVTGSATSHVHRSDNISDRSDNARIKTSPKPALDGYNTIVTKITETMED